MREAYYSFISARTKLAQVAACVLLVCLQAKGMIAFANVEPYWKLEAELRRDVNRNYFLSERDKRLVNRTLGQLEFSLGQESEAHFAEANFSSSYQEFSGSSEGLEARANQRFSANWSQAWDEKSSSRFHLNVNRDSTTADEFFNESVIFVEALDQDKRRLRVNSAVSWIYKLAPRWQTSTKLGAETIRYSNAEDTLLIPYQYWSASQQLSYQFSSRFEGWSQLSFDNYRPRPEDFLLQETNSVSSKTSTLNLGISYAVTEQDSLDLSAGVRQSRYKRVFDDGRSDEIGGVARFFYTREMLDSDLEVNLLRDIRPSSDGAITETDEAEVGYRFYHSERFNQRWKARVVSELIEGRTANSREDYRDFSWDLTWTISQSQRLSIQFLHRVIDRNDDEDLDRGNSFLLRWRWQGEKNFF